MADRYTLTARDVQAINSTSARLGIRPEDLTAVIMYETIGTMNPDIVGGKGNNYQGLIQFGKSERKAYGYRQGMGFAEQVEGPVYRYLKDRGLQPGMDIGRLYRTINGGNPNAKLTKNDGNGTIAQHIERIKSQFLPRAVATLQATPAGPDMSAIMDVASRNTAPSSVPDQLTAASGYAPDLGMSGTPAQAAIADLISAPPELTADQIDQLTMVDADGNYLNPPQSFASPPSLPPEWASAAGFPIDPELTGASADEVLMGGPRPSPNRPPMPASGPVGPTTATGVLDVGPRLRPPDMFVINPVSGAPDANTVPAPNLSPRNMIASAPVGPTTPQGVLDMGPNLRPADRWVAGAGGAPDAPEVPTPQMRPDPFASTFPARPEGPASGMPATPFETPFAGRPEGPATGFGPQFDMSAAIGAPPSLPPPDLTPASAPIMADPLFGIDRELADSMDRMRSERETLALANDIGFTRRNYIEPFQPAYRPPPPSPVEQRLDDATAPAPLITQNIPPSADGPTGNVVLPENDRGDGRQSFIDSIPAPPPIATGTGEFGRPENYPPGAFGPPPVVPAPLSGRFSDAFGPPTAGGIITDTPALSPVAPRIAGGGDPRTNIARLPVAEQPVIRAPDFSRPREQDMFSWEGAGVDPLWRTGSPLNQFRMKPEEFYDPALDRDRYFPPSPEVERNYRPLGFPQEASLQAPPAPTAMDGINALFVAPPAQTALPELASSFAAAPKPPGIDSPLYAPVPMAAATVPLAPPPQRDWSTTPPAKLGLDVAPPASRNWAAGMDTYVQNRFPASTFAGGSVIRPPTTPAPGQPGVVQGTMPAPAGAMDIRPPAQGGPPLPASVAPSMASPPPAPAPRQTNAGAIRNGGRGILGGIVGGALGGPIGALAGGLLGRSGIFGGGGGNGFGFGGQPSFAWSSGGNAPYGNNGGSTTYQKGTSNALGGSNALSWKGSGGQTVTVVTDPFTGTYYGPTYS